MPVRSTASAPLMLQTQFCSERKNKRFILSVGRRGFKNLALLYRTSAAVGISFYSVSEEKLSMGESVMEMLADGPSLVAGISVEGVVFNRGNKVGVSVFSMPAHVEWQQSFSL